MYSLQVLDLLKCSLLSKTPLTDLFLGENKDRKPSVERPRFFSCDFENNSDKFQIQITVKLVIRKSDNKLLYAQGEHDFADKLLSFLVSPLGEIVSLLGGCSLGSIDALHNSIVDLDNFKCFVSKEARDMIVVPQVAPQYFNLSKLDISVRRYQSYYCYYEPRKYNIEGVSHNQVFITNEHLNYLGNYCKLYHQSRRQTRYEGYVKGPRVYVVTDDLVISPLSPISLLHLLNRFETSVDDLKEKVVTIGIKEVIRPYGYMISYFSAFVFDL